MRSSAASAAPPDAGGAPPDAAAGRGRPARRLWAAALALFGLLTALGFVGSAAVFELWMLPGVFIVAAVLAAAVYDGGRTVMASRPWAWVLGVCVLAMAARLGCVLGVPYRPSRDFLMYHRAGLTMSREWTLRVPAGAWVYDEAARIQSDHWPARANEAGRVDYRCYYPPGQVFALGAMYALLGPRPLSGQLLNVAYGTLTVAGVWYVGRRLFGRCAGRMAALLAAVHPSLILACCLLGAEVPEAFWLVAALAVYLAWVVPGRRLGAAVLCGLVLGAGALIRPTYVLLPIPMGLHVLLAGRWRGRSWLAAGGLAVGMALAVLPWTWRNYRVTGGLVLICSNGGGNLYSANNDRADGAHTPAAWRRLYDTCDDDLALQRRGLALAAEWIRRHPGRFAALAGVKLFRTWWADIDVAWWALGCPSEDYGYIGVSSIWRDMGMAAATGFYAACLVFGWLGLWRDRRRLRRRTDWGVLPAVVLYFVLVHVVFEAQGKYHFMVLPLLCVLAALPAELSARRAGTVPSSPAAAAGPSASAPGEGGSGR
jgi:hypothetical protein